MHGVTNSEGGSAGFGRTEMSLATSAGFAGRYARSYHSHSASVLAGAGTGMQRDYDYHGAVHLADLDDPAAIGHSAGERAVSRLNPTRPKTGRMPVVYDPRVSGSLVGHLSGAINGASVARGTSFLKERMGQRLFRPRRVHPRRPAPPARRPVRHVRRRGRAHPSARLDRGRRADHLGARQPQRPPARAAHHRPCQPRHRRPARPSATNLYMAAGERRRPS